MTRRLSRDAAWPLALAAWGVLAIVLVFAQSGVWTTALVTIGFVLIAPGAALLGLSGIRDGAAMLATSIGASVGLALLIPSLLVYAHAWSPKGALLILVGLTETACALWLVRSRGWRRGA